MAGFIGEDQVRRVKESVDLVQIIGDYVPVSRAGVNFKACCPFHQERTPSFYIYTEDQHYHCFGCGAHGDAISFIRDRENLEFMEAMEMLARRGGIELQFDTEGQQDRGQRERLIRIMKWATECYEKALWEHSGGAEARTYLADRGLSEDVCRRFRLGWAPGRNALIDASHRERFSGEDLLALDLAMERNGRLTDRFFERLMFPICDRFGNPIAFSGRLLPEAERAAKEAGRGVGKYVNSTDTPLYKKSHVVFNLHAARKQCRDAGRIIVMEGPTDVMAADQIGIGECTAVLGTALTPDHARQLGNAVAGKGQVLLLFDGDAAGQANSLKAVRTCLSVGVPTRVVVLPEGKDPAEVLAGGGEAGRERFAALLDAQRPDLVHLLRTLAPRPHALDQRERIAVIDQLLDCIRPIGDRDLRDDYLDEASRYFGLEVERLRRRLGEVGSVEQPELPESVVPELPRQQEAVLHLLVRRPDLRGAAFDELGVEGSIFASPWDQFVQVLIERPEIDFDALLLAPVVERFPALREACFRWKREDRTRSGLDLAAGEAVLREIANGLQAQLLEAECRRLEHELRQAEGAGDDARAGQLFFEITELRRRLASARD